MADGTGLASQYVKLTKEHNDLEEEIKPGELNQPIRLPELSNRKCCECGQPLPESYEPPSDEPWSTGIFGCAEDTDSCWKGLFCPCVMFGENVESLRDDTGCTTPCIFHVLCVEGGMALAVATAMVPGIDPNTTCLIYEGLLFAWWMCGIYSGVVRQTLQRRYHLQDSPFDPCAVHCCLHWCAICQEHREMKVRLSEDAIIAMTVVNPPPVQKMSTADPDTQGSTEGALSVMSMKVDDQVTGLELQAL